MPAEFAESRATLSIAEPPDIVLAKANAALTCIYEEFACINAAFDCINQEFATLPVAFCD